MKNVCIILFVLFLPLTFLAQNDDPFANPSTSGDDPFAAPSTQPAEQPSDTDQFDANQPNPVDTLPQAGQTADDPFSDDATSDDPFASGEGGDFGELPFGVGATTGGSDILAGLSDTLIKPLRPQQPWIKQSIEERQIFEKHNVREADVFWAKTVWREIDVREKINHPFVNPDAPFMTVLLDIIEKDTSVQLYAYDPFVDAEFREETTWAEINESLGSTRTIDVPVMDDQGNITTTKQTITDKFNIGSVKKIRIKEVWYFDKVRSRMKVAIIGIAPIKETTLADLGVTDITMNLDGGGASTSEDPLFWVYYPDIREELARYETYNPLNDAIRMSWDDLFQSRYFSSYIVKASNPLDRYVAEYTRNSLAALYESERIKEEIFNFEHDLWTY